MRTSYIYSEEARAVQQLSELQQVQQPCSSTLVAVLINLLRSDNLTIKHVEDDGRSFQWLTNHKSPCVRAAQ